MSGTDRGRHEQEPAYVLHTYPYRETSLIVEAFTRRHGRIALVAKGARRPGSMLRGQLLSFHPLALDWFGRSELRNLARAEWTGGLSRLRGLGMICGFYVNELILRLLPRDDPHESLFEHYEATLGRLSESFAGAGGHEEVLRRFELRLLGELGYAPTLDREAGGGAAIEAGRRYAYLPERGAEPVQGEGSGLVVSGRTLLDLAADRLDDPRTLAECKLLMRALLNHHLGDQVLHTRQLIRDLQQL